MLNQKTNSIRFRNIFLKAIILVSYIVDTHITKKKPLTSLNLHSNKNGMGVNAPYQAIRQWNLWPIII